MIGPGMDVLQPVEIRGPVEQPLEPFKEVLLGFFPEIPLAGTMGRHPADELLELAVEGLFPDFLYFGGQGGVIAGEPRRDIVHFPMFFLGQVLFPQAMLSLSLYLYTDHSI